MPSLNPSHQNKSLPQVALPTPAAEANPEASNPPSPPQKPDLPQDQVTALAPQGKAQTVSPLGPVLATPEQVLAAVDQAAKNSYARIAPKQGESRHDLRERLQSFDKTGVQNPEGKVQYDGSDIVVIAFEGTGAFEPRQTVIMQEAAELLAKQGLQLEPDANLADKAIDAIQKIEGRDEETRRWSGLASGPLDTLLQTPELKDKTQWLSFPSEELELLSGKQALQEGLDGDSILEAVKQAKKSYDGDTPGINGALKTVQEIVKQAKAQGKNPKFMVVSHSSGGRSSVKFFEKAKSINGVDGKPLSFVWQSIDPVREAHEALIEAGQEHVNKSTEHNANKARKVGRDINDFKLFGVKVLDWAVPDKLVEHRKVYPATVGYDDQSGSLYKPWNVRKAVSFYQRQDTLGLKLISKDDLKGLSGLERWLKEGMMFGIHGSLIEGIENIQIKEGLGEDGHGAIAYQDKVTERFLKELKDL